MEIHIQLAGVELGPYSERQVRDYLQEGLLSSTDPARFEGTETWQTVEDILNARPATAPAGVEVSKQSELDATPFVATGTLPLPKTALRKTTGITTSHLPIPKPLSKDTIRVPIPQLNKAVAQQATLVRKAIQSVPQPPAPQTGVAAKSSEKARTSLLTAVKILAKKPGQDDAGKTTESAALPAKAATPSAAPIAFPKSTESRTMPLSVVRAISKKSDLSERPATPPEAGSTKPLPKFGSAPLPQASDPQRTTLLSAMPKLPSKKAEPEIKSEKVAESSAAPTAGDASFQSAKLPQTLRTAPMSPVRAILKKKDPEVKTSLGAIPAKPAVLPAEASPVEAVRFIPGSAPAPPGAVAKASSVSLKSLKRTTGSLPALVKVLEKKPGEVAAAPAVKAKEIKPPSTAHLPGDTDVADEAGEAKPSFFKSIGQKVGLIFRSSVPVMPKPKPETTVTPETVKLPEKTPVVEEKKAADEEKPVLKEKLATKEKPEVAKKPEVQEETSFAGTKPLLGLTTLPPAPEEDDEKTSPEADELFKKKFRSLQKKRGIPRLTLFAVIGVVLIVGLSCLGYFYVESSYQTAASLLQALKSGDQAQLNALIDFPSVRNALVDQVTAQAAKSETQDEASRTAVQDMFRNSINYYVTPEAISALASKTPLPPAGAGPMINSALAMDILSKLSALPVKTQSMIAYDHFVVDLDAAKLDLVFSGSGWKLEQIELNTGFKLPEVPGSAASPADLGASIAVPVMETYFEDGKTKFENKDWDGAIIDYTQVLAMDPKQVVAYSNRGMARASKKDWEGAIADFNQVIALDPKMAEAYFNRGVVKSRTDIDGAIADFSQAITLDPKMATAFYKRGTLRTQKGDFEGALADFTQDIELDPSSASAYSNRGYIKKAQHDLDGAINDFSQALAIDPKIVGAYYNRGLAKYEKADLDGAINDFNRALDLDPKMTRGYYSRGIAKNTKNDLDGALADYNQALALDPNLVPALTDRALVRQAKGDLKNALDDYNRALVLDPKIGSAYYERGLLKEQLGDLDGAIADSSNALNLDPKQAQAFYNRGFAKLVKGNLAGAKADLQKFCDLASKDPYADHARLYLWLIAMAQNPMGTANQDLSDTLQNNWSLGPDDLVTKIAQFLLGRETETDLIASAASTDPKKDAGHHCEVWYFAGMKRLLAGDKATAIDYFHKCLGTGQKDYCEYILAQAELQVLQPNPGE